MLTEGVRVSGICNADIADLGHNRGWRTLTVTRKGGKRQPLPLAPPVADALDRYLADRVGGDAPQHGDLQGPLFVTTASGPHRGPDPHRRQLGGC